MKILIHHVSSEIENLELEIEENSGKIDKRFKFSISLIAFSGAILYNMCNYFQNNPLNDIDILLLCVSLIFIAGSFISSCISLFFTALSYGVGSSEDKDYLEIKGKEYYLTSS